MELGNYSGLLLFCLLILTNKSLKRGEDNDRGKSKIAVNMGAVNQDFTVF